MTIRAVVWGENVHEQKNRVVADIYQRAAAAGGAA